ncbi:hypothetical protein HK102_004329 [Quaeritorhiza haematococci]|nr:hypothetical protein HK102_004329 [Quaeritorhiza haematococci]
MAAGYTEADVTEAQTLCDHLTTTVADQIGIMVLSARDGVLLASTGDLQGDIQRTAKTLFDMMDDSRRLIRAGNAASTSQEGERFKRLVVAMDNFQYVVSAHESGKFVCVAKRTAVA